MLGAPITQIFPCHTAALLISHFSFLDVQLVLCQNQDKVSSCVGPNHVKEDIFGQTAPLGVL